MNKIKYAPKSGTTHSGAQIKIHNNDNIICNTYQGDNMQKSQNVRKQFAIHDGAMYVYDGKCIYKSGSREVVIPDAQNGWQDLLDHLQEVQKCSSRQE